MNFLKIIQKEECFFCKESKTGLGSAFLEHLEAQIQKNYPLDANHGSAFVNSM